MNEWTCEQWEAMLSSVSDSDNLKWMLEDWRSDRKKLNALLDFIGDPKNGMVDLPRYARNRGKVDAL